MCQIIHLWMCALWLFSVMIHRHILWHVEPESRTHYQDNVSDNVCVDVCIVWHILLMHRHIIIIIIHRHMIWHINTIHGHIVMILCHRLSLRMCVCERQRVWEKEGTGWRRPLGCLNLQVIFCKRANNYRALLRKMTCKDKASYGSSPPCIVGHTHSNDTNSHDAPKAMMHIAMMHHSPAVYVMTMCQKCVRQCVRQCVR